MSKLHIEKRKTKKPEKWGGGEEGKRQLGTGNWKLGTGIWDLVCGNGVMGRCHHI